MRRRRPIRSAPVARPRPLTRNPGPLVRWWPLFALLLASACASPAVRVELVDGAPEEGGDGVVTYSSAHIEGVESELVVRSGHSTQKEPPSIEEVRRILLLHGDAR